MQAAGWTRIGKAQTRDGDDLLLRGEGRFAGDARAEGALWLHVLRSDHAAGEIRALDVAAAREAPGVHAVYTGADQDGLQPFALRYVPAGCEVAPTPFLPLATDRVRFAGEPVAAIVAESRDAALDAAELILLDIADAPAVTDARAAAVDGAPRVWADRPNLVFTQELGDRAAFEEACASADHVLTARLEISRVAAVALEPRNALATPLDGGRLHLRTGTQAPHRVKGEVAHVLGLDPGRIVVEAEHTGGSFGMRNGAYPEDVLVLMAAARLGRPVRWQATRSDSFLSDTQSREMSVDATLALDADGRFLALGVDGYAPVGAQLGQMAMHPMSSNMPGIVGVYRTPVLHTVMRGVFVNTMHMAPYRGAGRPEAIYIMERMVDLAAAALGLDPAELRRRNMIPAAAMPYATPLGYVYDSGDFEAALDTVLTAGDWAGFADRRADSQARGMLRGIGLAAAIEPAGGGPKGAQLPEFARIELDASGARLATGSGDAGQGHGTVFRQVLHDLLGWDGDVTVVAGDTDAVPKGVGTFGSRTMGAAGHAMATAAREIIAKATAQAARHLDVPEGEIAFADGSFKARGTNRVVTLHELCTAQGARFEAEAFVATDAGTLPNGAHLAEVEVDPETGAVQVLSYCVADDVGTVINPLLVEGQVHGGVAQGLGQALYETLTYDETGALLSGSFMDYALPRADDLPFIAVHHSPTPTRANALGAKGAGESGTVGALPAVMNAVCNALASAGAGPMDMPATPARVWAALNRKETP
ncbi:carbon-monoxide dehydrogenase large subunit [Roseivivax lentus]|uniref:Carbon-monoxide dehydrogenase large subunit n=1 Tax=Roseivivax lentus TaxID=633194 RepID=A0A1N7LNS0_9RHOB|nr:xanthine dehydrogenase family protein molybdopterin-binding subunit [Roseivivax lentus]SIS75432.1 carbon-monoxide dehydrogenase large subunit [Roseivivax lentus]